MKFKCLSGDTINKYINKEKLGFLCIHYTEKRERNVVCQDEQLLDKDSHLGRVFSN